MQPELEQLLARYPETLTVAEVATVLRVHQRSIQRWAREGRVVSVRVGRSYRFLRADVLRWMHGARTPETDDVERVSLDGRSRIAGDGS